MYFKFSQYPHNSMRLNGITLLVKIHHILNNYTFYYIHMYNNINNIIILLI